MSQIDNTINNIGKKIKYYRQLNKISLSKLANNAHISKSTLFGLEEGKSNPTISTLINIANTLDIDLKELIGSNLEALDSKLNLISNSEDYSLYKLTLLANELYKLSSYNTINIEIQDGAVLLLPNNLLLLTGDSSITNAKLLKAKSSGVTAFIKIYNKPEIAYTKSDIFINKVSKELLNEVAYKTLNGLINRVVSSSITPHKKLEDIKYINYIESIYNKESHYYFFKRFIGLTNAYSSILKKGNINIDTSKVEILNRLIELSTTKKELNQKDLEWLFISPTKFAQNSITKLFSSKYSNLIVISSLPELLSLNIKKDKKVLFVADLIENLKDSKNISLTVAIYRALESLYILNESSLNPNEYKLHSILVTLLPEALYYAYNKKYDRAISSLKSLIDKFYSLELNDNTEAIYSYSKIVTKIEDTVKDSNKTLDSFETVELIAKDLGYTIKIKELLSSVVGKNGLYIYLLD